MPWNADGTLEREGNPTSSSEGLRSFPPAVSAPAPMECSLVSANLG
jgi:hypothetical protein